MNALTPGDFIDAAEPFNLFGDWFEEAKAKELNDPEAMALATADANGLPDARMVLLKGWSESGFVFYTNAESAKGVQLEAEHAGGAAFPLEIAAPANSRSRPGGARGRQSAQIAPITPAGRATAGSAPGPASSRARSKAASRWKKP